MKKRKDFLWVVMHGDAGGGEAGVGVRKAKNEVVESPLTTREGRNPKLAQKMRLLGAC